MMSWHVELEQIKNAIEEVKAEHRKFCANISYKHEQWQQIEFNVERDEISENGYRQECINFKQQFIAAYKKMYKNASDALIKFIDSINKFSLHHLKHLSESQQYCLTYEMTFLQHFVDYITNIYSNDTNNANVQAFIMPMDEEMIKMPPCEFATLCVDASGRSLNEWLKKKRTANTYSYCCNSKYDGSILGKESICWGSCGVADHSVQNHNQDGDDGFIDAGYRSVEFEHSEDLFLNISRLWSIPSIYKECRWIYFNGFEEYCAEHGLLSVDYKKKGLDGEPLVKRYQTSFDIIQQEEQKSAILRGVDDILDFCHMACNLGVLQRAKNLDVEVQKTFDVLSDVFLVDTNLSKHVQDLKYNSQLNYEVDDMRLHDDRGGPAQKQEDMREHWGEMSLQCPYIININD